MTSTHAAKQRQEAIHDSSQTEWCSCITNATLFYFCKELIPKCRFVKVLCFHYVLRC